MFLKIESSTSCMIHKVFYQLSYTINPLSFTILHKYLLKREINELQKMQKIQIITVKKLETENGTHTGILLPTLSQNSFLWCTFELADKRLQNPD